MAKNESVLQFRVNQLYLPLYTTKKRYIDLWGGRSRGGSHTATDYFLFLLIRPDYFRGIFTRAVKETIKDSLWKDFKDRLEVLIESGTVKAKDFKLNETTYSATYLPTGNSILSKGFRKSSSSQSAKLKSLAGATHVIIEECEEITEDEFNDLDDGLRTTKVEHIQIIRLWNPPSKNHWLIKNYYNLIPSGLNGWYKAVQKPETFDYLLSIHSTYRDNLKNVNETTKVKFAAYGDPESPLYNPDKYYRNVCGLISEGKKGRIFKNCLLISKALYDELPYPKFYGLDFGFSSDPLALVEHKYHNGRLYRHQLIYRTELLNSDLIKEMNRIGISRRHRIYADNAEPKTIRELQNAGFIVIASVKGPDSIRAGIKQLQNEQIYTTDSSRELWLENEEYSWELDKEGNPTDEPEDKNNHGWDATRYAYMANIKANTTVKVAGGTRKVENKDKWMEW